MGRMKPDWDKLMAEFKDSKTALVGDVDCTAGGKELCNEVGVRGYPTIKYGDPSDLQDYKGGRSFDDLKKFAGDLKPSCSPKNIDLCDEDKKKSISEFKAMGVEKREAMIKEMRVSKKSSRRTSRSSSRVSRSSTRRPAIRRTKKSRQSRTAGWGF